MSSHCYQAIAQASTTDTRDIDHHLTRPIIVVPLGELCVGYTRNGMLAIRDEGPMLMEIL
ncbi:hypothetical protein PAXRUDRAFT_828902 [Paxillus rubicundulus Ve08.2h10]|uniref:Uncharacterized protein n=1 Tax=Paxillus rubicundulus Ve08.2h10 TaxID=930991 RepID=A0A0D0D945_9AGAM|nr:hypothetical protein PAXRUDRAFT_828902 [Paxillus rubicundulus Ve08.2h10]